MGNPAVSSKQIFVSPRLRAIKSKHHARENLAYFRRLGLRMGEARAHVIRTAATNQARRLNQFASVSGDESVEARRHEIAVATYRLLDPRRRQRLVERVQLTYSIDRDEHEIAETFFSTMPRARQASAPSIQSRGSRESARSGDDSQEGERKSSREPSSTIRQIIDRSCVEPSDEMVPVKVLAESNTWLEERREIVSSLRRIAAEEESHRDHASQSTFAHSTLTWLFSFLRG